jgi:hypothetical protein
MLCISMGGDRAAMELLWRSFSGSEDEVPSPDRHGEVLSERLAKVEAGEGKFLTLPELHVRLAAVRAEAVGCRSEVGEKTVSHGGTKTRR